MGGEESGAVDRSPAAGSPQRWAATDYEPLLAAVKAEIAGAQVQVARVVNTELVALYWRIGRLILDLQAAQAWGAQVVDRLAVDLGTAFPDARGFSRRNLQYMRAFAAVWPADVPQAVAHLPWGHVRILLDRVDGRPTQEWYAQQATGQGWSRRVLETMIASRLDQRQGAAPSNFPARLPDHHSDLAQQMTRDPYVFDFVRLQPGFRERDLQAALLAGLRRFLLELGVGFAVVGEQYPVAVGGTEFSLDLLCYHTRLHRYVVFELKLGRFEPRDLGQLQFYVQAVDAQVRAADVDESTIGILLVADRDETVVQYALQSSTAPIAVSRYELPEEVRHLLPADDELRRVAQQVASTWRADDGPDGSR
jgi:predicted nuclease of restriction endonuclease-like (RecB) superfamily